MQTPAAEEAAAHAAPHRCAQVSPGPDRSLRLQVEGALAGPLLHGESEDEVDAYKDAVAATGS